jgi:protein O-mannosyl-transferase
VDEFFRRHRYAAGTLLVLIALLYWYESVHGGFITMDSTWLVTENTVLIDGELSSIPKIFLGFDNETRWGLGAEYLPIRDLSVWLDFRLYGTNWTFHHLTNLIIYILGCLLLYEFLVSMFGDRIRAFTVTMLFCLLPVHVENVAWLAGRKDVLGFFFSVLTLKFILRGPVSYAVALSALSYLLALWSKNTSICVVFWIYGIILLFYRERWKGMLSLPTACFGVITSICLITSIRVGGLFGIIAESYHKDPIELLVLQGRLFLRYLELVLDPSALCLYHPLPEILPITQLVNFGGVLVFVVCLLSIPIFSKSKPILSLALFVLLTALLPVSHLIPLQNPMADRYMLLPSIGIVLSLCALPKKIPFDLLLLALALICGSATRDRIKLWHSDSALLQDVVQKRPGNHKYETMAVWAAVNESISQAEKIDIAVLAVQRYPDIAGLHHILGKLKLRGGEYGTAQKHFEDAVGLSGDSKIYHHDLAVSLHRQKKHIQALEMVETLTKRFPKYANGWITKSAICIDANLPELGIRASSMARTLAPNDANVWCNSGTLSYMVLDYDAARSHWSQCQRLEPSSRAAAAGLAHLELILAKPK